MHCPGVLTLLFSQVMLLENIILVLLATDFLQGVSSFDLEAGRVVEDNSVVLYILQSSLWDQTERPAFFEAISA